MAAADKNPPRKLASWIDAFCEYTAILSSPLIFRKWAAIGAISAVLERRVFVRSMGSDLYPNLYMVLVGPPGVGKSQALTQAERLIRNVPGVHLAPSNVSSASLIDALGEAKRDIPFPPPLLSYNCLVVVASEFGNLIPIYEPAFMNLLTKVYDGETIEDRKRTKNVSVKIEKPLVTLLGGTTPSYLNSFLPDGAWDQGFTSRTIFVFSGERITVDPFANEEKFAALEKIYNSLLYDLKAIGMLLGRIQFEPLASARFSRWHMAGGPPVPTHGKLLHYNPRRTAHMLKLCIIAAVSRGAPLIAEIDFETALGWLIEAEEAMPDIFKSMGSSGDNAVSDDAWYAVYAEFNKTKQPIPERLILKFIQARVPSYNVMNVLNMMVKTDAIVPKGFGPDGRQLYVPGAKH